MVREAGTILYRLKGKDVGCSATRFSLPQREERYLRVSFERVFRGQRVMAERLGCEPFRVRLMKEWRVE